MKKNFLIFIVCMIAIFIMDLGLAAFLLWLVSLLPIWHIVVDMDAILKCSTGLFLIQFALLVVVVHDSV